MRIAIYHNLPSGGGKRALWGYARGLAERHELAVFSLSSANHEFCDLRALGIPHTILPFEPLPVARSPFGRLNQGIRAGDLVRLKAVQREVAALIDAGDFDVAFVQNCRFNQSPALLRYLKTPSAYYCAEPPRFLYEPAPTRPYLALTRKQASLNRVDPLPAIYRSTLGRTDRENTRAASLVLANSDYSRETFFHVYGLMTKVCRLGVDLDTFRPVPSEKGNFVISTGALSAHKGFDFIIEAIGRIELARRPRLVIVSNYTDQRELAYLKALAANRQATVEFREGVPDAELVMLYNQALLTLYTPRMEPFGLVPLESMACGTPVVGLREAGVRESVRDEETGVLTERDPALFAGAVVRLLDSPELRSRLGAQAINYVRHNWTWEQATIMLERFLGSLAHSKA